jgi:hypothetical protein
MFPTWFMSKFPLTLFKSKNGWTLSGTTVLHRKQLTEHYSNSSAKSHFGPFKLKIRIILTELFSG